ncbi:MAG: MFS transporter, partial [Chloroflexi bacterium]|nr:MFS transporter [Chloroflexota bacterium]
MSQISKSTDTPEELAQETVSAEHPRYRRATLLLFSASTFLFWAAMYLYVPILPAYTESLGASLSMVGAVIGSYAIAQVLIRAPIGILADSFGRRKPFIVGGLVFTSLGGLALAVAPNPWFLFAGRALTGVAAATWVVSSVFFISYFPPERAARGIGIISFVNGAAIIAATSIGGQLAELFGPQSVFFIGALLGVLGVLFLLPVAETTTIQGRSSNRESYLRVAVNPVLLIASLMSILVHFASAASISSFTLVYAGRLGASSGDLGIVSAAFLGASMMTTLLAVYLVEKRGYSFTILLGAAIMGASLLATP